jgi:ABC-type phosphate transport system substrate-binding protein
MTSAGAACQPALPIASPTPDTQTLSLVADHASAPLLQALMQAYQNQSQNVIAWDIQIGDPATAAQWLLEGKAAYGLVGLVADDPRWWMTPVGELGIAFVINAANPLATELSAGQLRGLLQGRISNWAALAGPDLPVTIITQAETALETVVVQSIVLGQRPITPTAQLAFSAEDVLAQVRATPGALGYVAVGNLLPNDPNLRVLPLDGQLPVPASLTDKTYPIRTPIVFMGLSAPGDDAYRAFFAWVQSPAGQAVVKSQHGGLAGP